VLTLIAAAPVAAAAQPSAAAAGQGGAAAAPASGRLEVGIVSRHLQFTNMEEAIAIAKEAGFDSIEWNVRRGGHVEPENVERDLPRCLELTRQAGLAAPMITTSIADVESPHAERILAAASGLGVTHYRAEGLHFDYTQDLERQLEALKPRLAAVNALSTKYRIAYAYHTHSSVGDMGGTIVALWSVMKDFDPAYIGLNYDIGHATRRAGPGVVDGLHIAHRYIKGLAIKDFAYVPNPQTGGLRTEWTPVGLGQINLRQAFEILKAKNWRGPINIHYEHHGLLGSSLGQYKLPVPLAEFKTLIRADLDYVRGVMQALQL
jgi:sugar phosphate isomerase/epimerase